MLYPALHIITGAVVGYNAYTHAWKHVVRLFEQMQRPKLAYRSASTQNLVMLFSQDEDMDIDTRSLWFRTVRWSQHGARVTFALTITTTVLTIQFVLWQFQYDNISTLDLWLWECNLLMMILVLVFIQPALLCVLLLNRLLLKHGDESSKVASCTLVLMGWLVFVSKGHLATDMDVVEGAGFLSYYTQRVSVMGVTLIGILNGVGSYSTVYYYLYKKVDAPSRLSTNVNRLISLYCLFKVAQVSIVHLLQYIHSNDINTSKSDPLVVTLAHVLQMFTAQDDDFLINQLSFIISGALFILSFNGVFLTLTHLYRFLPLDIANLQQASNNKAVSAIKNMVVSELLGVYVLATLVILKSNLTASYSQNLTQLTLTQGMDIGVVDNWFDKVYLMSVVVTGVVIRVGEVWVDDGCEEDAIAAKIV